MHSEDKKNKKSNRQKNKFTWTRNSLHEEMLKIIEEVLQGNLQQVSKKEIERKGGPPIRVLKRKYS